LGHSYRNRKLSV